MDHLLTRKLQNYVRLPEADRLRLVEAMKSTRRIAAREDIILEGDHPSVVNVVVEGWACRYKLFEDGRRQIVSLLLPGDLCDP